MKLKKFVTCFLAAAIAAGGVLSGTGRYSYLRSEIVSAAVSVPKAGTVLKESAYITWTSIDKADGYNVYVKPEGGSYTQLDSMLIRQYSSYFRADAVGLKAGKYIMKVVPTTGGKEDTSKALESGSITVEAHDRSGYAWSGGTASGAYNEDGTLKSNAVVVYVTNENKDTVTAKLNAEGKGEVDCVGVRNIILAYKKKKETRPLCMRFIGNITDPAELDKGDLYIDTAVAGMTIEGIGNDTTFNGFGLVMKNCVNVEVRNIGFMNCNSTEGDDVGLQQGNTHCWVHNCDFFYGDAGSDADQVKGDGALDTKKSQYITHSYNHFWDNGKCNLQGANTSDTSNYITYHHNWYDHSDSRHPRVRVATVHAYNNYYDGNAKYGIGVTTGASLFSENNNFRNCKYPMLTAMQGSDAKFADNPEKGTFGGEDGGFIKAYGNVMTGQKSFIPYSEDNTDFDAYVVSKRDETVPSSAKAKKGGATYSNFDVDLYDYKVDDAKDVPTIVTAGAGRVDGGDFQWKFDNSVDDASSDVNEALKAALVAYDDKIVAIGSGFTTSTTTPDPTAPPTTASTDKPTTKPTTQAPTDKPTTKPSTTVTQEIIGFKDTIYCSPDAKSSGKGTKDDPIDVLSALKMVKPGVAIRLLSGTYKFDKTIVIDDKTVGESDLKYKVIMADPGVVWDFSAMATDASNRGVVLEGDYWYISGFEITKAGDNGMLLSGSNNRIELMQFNDNQDTGLQISRYKTENATIDTWPSNNLILNCTAKNNCDDKTMENADGFAAKLTCGEGNVFDGCMSYNNSDDGWDLFAKTDTGPIGVVTLRNCIAFRNGFTEFGEGFGDCDGNGFKLGGSGVGTAHVVENCLAFENLHCGFTDNNNPKLGTLKNCSAYNNGVGGKPNISCYRCTDDGCDFINTLTYVNADKLKLSAIPNASTKVENDKFVGTMENSVYYNGGNYYYVGSKTNIANNEKIGEKGVSLTEDDFVSLEVASYIPPAYDIDPDYEGELPGNYDFHTQWRNEDGSINTHGFMQLKETSKFAELGANFESVEQPTPPTPTDSTEPPTPPVPTNVIPDGTKYGDVNEDEDVNIADVVKLNLYLLDSKANAITDTAIANADVARDNKIDLGDAGFLMSYTVETIVYEKLGAK